MEEEKDEKHSEPTCPWEAAWTAASFITLDLLPHLVTRPLIREAGAVGHPRSERRAGAEPPHLVHARPPPWFLLLSETRPLFCFFSPSLS